MLADRGAREGPQAAGRLHRAHCACGDPAGRGREPQARSRSLSLAVEALTAMGLGSRRVPGSPALLLLLLLPLLWLVWGAETLRGECERAPRGTLGHRQGMERWNSPYPSPGNRLPGQRTGRVWEGVPGTCPGILTFTWARGSGPDLHTLPSCHCAHDKAEWQGSVPLSSLPALKPLCLDT